ncbi:unnamed protein product, partial [Mesorhabditis spiculigera]
MMMVFRNFATSKAPPIKNEDCFLSNNRPPRCAHPFVPTRELDSAPRTVTLSPEHSHTNRTPERVGTNLGDILGWDTNFCTKITNFG